MSTSFSISLAGPSLRELAAASGPTHAAACAGLLDLFATSEALRSALRDELTRLQLSETGFSLLTLLHRRGSLPLGCQEIARQLALATRSASEALARLEMAGLITRTYQAEPGRQMVIRLTDLGQTTIQDALQAFEKTIHRLMSVLSPADLAALHRSCARLDPPATSL